MQAANNHLPRQAQHGVGLIEVLIAVLILSIGFLGIAALQAKALSTNNSAMSRSMAVVASYSILDAMRADRSNALNGSYNTSSPLKADACPTTTGTLAQTQLNTWCNQLGQNLGALASTTGNVNCSAAGDCTITVTFDESRMGTNSGGTDNTGLTTITTRAML
ncbi:type IV pilus modification protein PilV [Halothiobacillus sp. DCM-1]|uniref:type IV pilus modification protein PilV n=1 Tax=Halothiobacillus sp. DCM-1 TaxID=3112558 RepID=UPI003252AF9E